MTAVYPIILTATNDEKDTYLVEIPDLKGFTEGFGLSNAITMARDYIGCACFDKDTIPKASRLSDINVAEGTFAGDGESFATLVDVDLDVYKRKMMSRAVRKNVSIPYWLNEEAEKNHINVSKVLQEALKEKLEMA